MTRKDYIRIAAAMKEARNHWLRADAPNTGNAAFQFGLTAAAREVARVLADDNPRFDRARFLKACGVEG